MVHDKVDQDVLEYLDRVVLTVGPELESLLGGRFPELNESVFAERIAEIDLEGLYILVVLEIGHIFLL